MDYGIDKKCQTNTFFPKKDLIAGAANSSSDKALITQEISKITITHQMHPGNTNINGYKDDIREYPHIVFMTVLIKQPKKSKQIAELILRSIPYPLVITFECDDKYQIWTAHQRTNKNDADKNTLEEIISSEWLDMDENILDVSKMNMTNFYILYCDIVDAISVVNVRKIVSNEDLSGEEARDIINKTNALDTQINALRAKLKKETQFNNKVALNIQIKKLEQEKEKIINNE